MFIIHGSHICGTAPKGHPQSNLRVPIHNIATLGTVTPAYADAGLNMDDKS